MSFKLESSAFASGAEIPRVYTGEGEDRSPPLTWSGAPSGTKTYALIVHDPDAPKGDFVHWVAFNIPVQTTKLVEDTPHSGDLTDGTLQGVNGFGRIGYGGPKPPPGKPHKYMFVMYALDTNLALHSGARRDELERAMRGHVLARTDFWGRYKAQA